MHGPRAHVALLVDYQNVRLSLAESASQQAEAKEASSQDGAGRNGSEGEVNSQTHTTREVARSLVAYADSLGRLGASRAYADWSRVPKLARQFNGTGLTPVLVPATEQGDDRSHIRLAVDAMDCVMGADHPDALVLVSNDATLVPLVESVRSRGCEVYIVGGEGAGADELKEEADAFIPLLAVLDGERGSAVRPRPITVHERAPRSDAAPRGNAAGSGGPRGGQRASQGPQREVRDDRRERSYQGPLITEPDFHDYEWDAFVRLIDELEQRLPFVGVRYLVNKVLAPHNCGVADPRLKRDLINEAVDEGIIEMYSVGNVDDRTDPVTACRLDRHNDIVVEVLGEAGEDDLDDDLDEDFDDDDEFDDDIENQGGVESETAEHASAD